MELFKTCNKCKKTLPVTSFTKDKSKDDALSRACRSCVNLYAKQYAAANREKLLAWARKWAEGNRQKVRDRNSAWREINGEERNAKWRAEYEANPDYFRTQAAEYRKRNPEKTKATRNRPAEKLTDNYIVHLIRDKVPIPIPRSEIPKELIETTRQYVKLKRLLKEETP